MKDSHLREIARIRNENAVEITKLKKVIDSRAESNSVSRMSASQNHAAFKVKASFADNEVER